MNVHIEFWTWRAFDNYMNPHADLLQGASVFWGCTKAGLIVQMVVLQAGSVFWAMTAGLTVQRVTCTCMGAGLAVRRVLCTSSQLAWTCKKSCARSHPRANHAEGFLHVQGSRPRRVEGTLHVQSTCLDVQRILSTVKLSRNSIYGYIGSKKMVSRTPPFK